MNTGSDKAGEATMTADRAGRAEADEEPQERALGSRAPAFVKARRALHVSCQVGVFVVGLAVVAAGAAMLVLPGPGWVVIFAGLANWGCEFAWLPLGLRRTKREGTGAGQRGLGPKVRCRNIILTAGGLVIAGVVEGVYLRKFGPQMPWKLPD